MPITIHPDLEAKLRARADAAEELECLAMEGVNSGGAIAIGPAYWTEKHRNLDERLKSANTR